MCSLPHSEEQGPIDEKAQIQFLAEPFHRMFFLDNLAINYPHAEVERVSVGKYTIQQLFSLMKLTSPLSMALHLRRCGTPRHHRPLGCPRPSRYP
jgi:hypothetical protein